MSTPTDPKPEGFIYSSIPVNKREAISQSAESRVTMTVKSAIQDYLDSYFSPTGRYRHQLSLTADFSIQYETSLSAPRSDDPSVYELQLTRLFSQMREKFPMILIIDAGFEYTPAGLGGIVNSQVLGRRTSTVGLKMDCKVPIKLSIAALDETTCQDIRDLLFHIFGVLTVFNKSHLIRSRRPEDSWEIRLPLKYESGGLDKQNITDDHAQLLWTAEVTIEPEFEGTIHMAFANQLQTELQKVQPWYEGQIPNGTIDSSGNIVADNSGTAMTRITVPETVTLGMPTPLSAPFIPADCALISDNPRIALVNGYTIIPKRIGTFNLYLQTRNAGVVKQSWSIRVVG